MPLKTAIPIMVLIVLLCGAGAYYYGESKYQEGMKPFGTGDDDGSPIIITGGSVHFAQANRWSYQGQSKIAARLPDHKPDYVATGYCAAAGSSNCTVVGSPVNIAGKNWGLDLCSGVCGAGGSITAASVNYDKDGNDSHSGQHDSDDVEIASQYSTFQTEAEFGNGRSLVLVDTGSPVVLSNIKLTIGGATNPLDCPSLSGSQVCYVKICYKKGGASCP